MRGRLRDASICALWLLPAIFLARVDTTVIDDAYISFRYARNLVHGLGLVFNAGERVEGFTNLSWTLLMTVPIRLGWSVAVFAALTGFVCGLYSLLMVFRICRKLELSASATWSASFALAVYPSYWLAVTNGLEGGLFSALLIQTVYLFLFDERLWLTGLFCGLLFCTRPESAFVLLLLIAFKRDRLRELALPSTVLIASVEIWRLAYYHALVPNTITAKSLNHHSVSLLITVLSVGLGYCGRFLLQCAPLISACAAALAVARHRRVVVIALLLLAAEMLVVTLNGGDWMPDYRLLVVFAPLLAVGAAILLDRATRHARLWLALALLLVSAWSASQLSTLRWRKEFAPHRFELEPFDYGELARTLAPHLLPGDVIAPEAIGIIGYVLPDSYIHDFFAGLTDRWIARNGTFFQFRYGKSDFLHSYQLRPTLFVLHSQLLHIRPLVAASNGKFLDEYQLFSFNELLVAVRRDAVVRLIGASDRFKPL
jgi:hypothetical protein